MYLKKLDIFNYFYVQNVINFQYIQQITFSLLDKLDKNDSKLLKKKGSLIAAPYKNGL